MGLSTSGTPGVRWVLTGIAAILALAGSALLARTPDRHGADPVFAAEGSEVSLDQSGWLELFVNPDALDYLGLSLPIDDDSLLRATLRPGERPLRVRLGDKAPTSIGDGYLLADGLRFTRRSDGAVSPALRVVAAGDGLALSFRDEHDREWARILQIMRSPDVAKDGFRYITANFAVGEALLAFAGRPQQGLSIANAGLQLPFAVPGAMGIAKSEANPVWPGTPGTVTDVLLDSIPIISTDMPGIETMRCRQVIGGGTCDGPGGTEGEVVITPEARLRNSSAANATDVPWYRMFSEASSAYPEGTPKIDQHPYLIWNLYRLDADGSIRQIGRSGAKHAFATANEYCNDYTHYGSILGPGCSDLYNVHSNECERFLGPRSEIIPKTGQWGRCGSIQDPDCNPATNPVTGFTCVAAPDSPARDKYSYRLRARESAIDMGLHPGSRWMMEAWYVVRDDQNIHNTMGSREVFPAYSNTLSRWQMGLPGPFVLGSVLDRWLADAAANESTHRAVADTAEGEITVAVRISRLGDGRFRYDYAVMNFDFARAQTDTMTEEPNLRITSSHGLDGAAVELVSGASVEESLFDDGNSEAADDWAASAITGGWQWMAPATPDAELEWGQLRFFRLISSDWPGSGSMTLQVAGGGMPASYAVTVPAPDGSIHLFGDAFE
ncbi:MAG: hypothetical protein KDI75_04305 [Xanthomonadales bacterium]|nr:hypothetical protein [Xanthomonadales bacterium]